MAQSTLSTASTPPWTPMVSTPYPLITTWTTNWGQTIKSFHWFKQHRGKSRILVGIAVRLSLIRQNRALVRWTRPATAAACDSARVKPRLLACLISISRASWCRLQVWVWRSSTTCCSQGSVRWAIVCSCSRCWRSGAEKFQICMETVISISKLRLPCQPSSFTETDKRITRKVMINKLTVNSNFLFNFTI